MKWALLVLSLLTTLAAAEEPQKKPQQFHLCSAFVEQASMGEPNSFGWPVFVKLTPVGRQSFETLTQRHIGKEIEILAGGQTFSRAIISATMTDGVLQQSFGSQKSARLWQARLAQGVAEAPCGTPDPNAHDQGSR